MYNVNVSMQKRKSQFEILHVIVHILKFCEQQRKDFFVFFVLFLFCFVDIVIFLLKSVLLLLPVDPWYYNGI